MTEKNSPDGRYSGLRGAPVATLPGVDLAASDPQPSHQQTADRLKPKKLSAAQRHVWDRLGPTLVEMGRLTPLTADAFLEYCDIKVELDTLKALRQKQGYSFSTTGRHGEQAKTYPEVIQLNNLRAQFTQLCAHFGLTPATETRFADGRKGESGENPFAK